MTDLYSDTEYFNVLLTKEHMYTIAGALNAMIDKLPNLGKHALYLAEIRNSLIRDLIKIEGDLSNDTKA